MRIRDLWLRKFGPFSAYTLDFGPGEADLHVILGANEAGKSTTLRAISGLLFGIPETTRDHHLHEMKELRIGARLENANNERIAVLRRKGRKNTLLDEAEKPLDETCLDGFLGGVGRELFETMFGLSHEALVAGGQQLLAGKGELGESLFGASAGVRGLHNILTDLQAEHQEIFTPRAQQRPLNLALKAFAEAKRESRQHILRPQEWQEKQKQRTDAQARFQALEQTHTEAQAQYNRLTRLKRVLPALNRRRELLEQHGALEGITLLAEDCTERRRDAWNKLHSAALQEQKYRDELQRCEDDKNVLNIPEAVFARAAAIEALRDQLGAHKKAANDLDSLNARVIQAREEARGLLRELGRDDCLDNVEQLRVTASARARIRKFGKQGEQLQGDYARLQRELSSAENRRQPLAKQCEAGQSVADDRALIRLLGEIRRHGDLEQQARDLAVEVGKLAQEAERQAAALPLWQGTPVAAVALKLPLAETVERFAGELATLTAERQRLSTERERIERNLKTIDDQLATLEKQGEVPTEATLIAARLERDGLWRIARALLLGAEYDRQAEQLADDYESWVQQADAAAERLWQDAERVAKHAALTADRERLQTEDEQFGAELAALAALTNTLDENWRGLWQTVGIAPLTPAEMSNWLRRHEQLVDSVGRWQAQNRAHAALLEMIDEERRRCDQALIALGEPAAAADETLAALLVRADETVNERAERRQQQRSLERDLEQAVAAKQARQEELNACASELHEWRERWAQAVQPLGLDAAASAEEAEAILESLGKLFDKLRGAQDLQNRIDHIDDDTQVFTGEVAALIRECAPDLAELVPVEAAEALIARLHKVRDDYKTRTNLEQRSKQIQQELDELKRDREAALTTLEELKKQAGADDLEALEEAERQSKTCRDLASKIAGLTEQLTTEDVPLATLEEQAQAVDPDTLPALIEETRTRCGNLVEQRDQCRETFWRLQRELDEMDGGAQAAQAAAEAETVLAEIKTRVETYVRLKLGARLLEREIERYRERHQGPIVQRAGELFRRMTLGSFNGLATGFTDGDKIILLGVREDGRRVPVEGLSEGSRDQLYLALRLAGLERHLEHNEPLPVVVDDILINFDDRRAQATLALLGELSRQTQVLFFTHHRRLLELARETLPAEQLRTHELAR